MNASSKHIGWGIAAVLFGFGAGAAACGDDGGGGGGSGVSGGKTVEDVTDEDAKKLCLWTFEQATKIELSDRELCEAFASSQSASTSECKTLVDACLKDPPELDTDSEPACDDAEAAALPASCADITVSDYEACIRGVAAAYKKALTSLSCSRPGEVPEFSDVMDDPPSSCKKILDDCPEMLGDLFDDSGE